MKNTSAPKKNKVEEMAAEYRLDYKKAKPNRFAKEMKSKPPVVVLLDDDVAKVFKTAEQVNTALRALISAMPKSKA
ncbi:MAG: hypothetical protein HYZ25_08050 [Chloroflexi bacterium]|nr:hypothetical protein [Chloroflexota bacterium]